jgi:hypothetical protein
MVEMCRLRQPASGSTLRKPYTKPASPIMNRRDFIAASGALGLGLPASQLPIPGQSVQSDQQLLEWMSYSLHVGARRNLVSEFYRDVAIPALNRIGIGPVGVFSVRYGQNQPTLYTLLPHSSMESVLNKSAALLEDDTFMQDGSEFLGVSLTDSAYARSESSLMLAFSHIPKVEPPTSIMASESRVYELRIYESHSVVQGKKKVHMFNEGGEIEIFRETGLTPIFFGETIIGPRMPNLTYLLAFESMAVRDENWDRFRNHPDWLSLRQNPYYADTVSNISDIMLSPASFSQI